MSTCGFVSQQKNCSSSKVHISTRTVEICVLAPPSLRGTQDLKSHNAFSMNKQKWKRESSNFVFVEFLAKCFIYNTAETQMHKTFPFHHLSLVPKCNSQNPEGVITTNIL